ncbi:MAG TPA: universal stress protein [Nocardioides sp.]|nr:universal stress protein [Nocardioides sp.]
MSTNTDTRTGAIVVGVDGSPLGEHAVLWAAEEARLQNRSLLLVHAIEPISANQLAWLSSAGIPPHQVNREAQDVAARVIERARTLADDRRPAERVETEIRLGDPRRVLLDHAERAPLVVVGTRGHGRVAGLLLGSVSGAVLRHATCPVAVVRPGPAESRGVLLGVDLSLAALPAVEVAFEQASQRGLPLTVVHCLWDTLIGRDAWAHVDPSDPDADEARRLVAETLAGAQEKYPDVAVRVELTRGAIEDCLVHLSQLHELLVIGRSAGRLRHLTWGAHATTIAEHAHSPVLVVP